MIANILSHEKLQPIVTKLFLRNRKKKYFSCFYYTILFAVPNNIRLNSTGYFILKIPNKQGFKQVPINCSSDINFKHFMKLYKKCIAEPLSFLDNNTTLPADNSLRFRHNLLESI